jgi:hypothetical protein
MPETDNTFKPGIHSCTYAEALLKLKRDLMDRLYNPTHRAPIIAALAVVYERSYKDVSDDLAAVIEGRMPSAKLQSK